MHTLGERVKELNCLYGLSKLVERSYVSLEEIYQGAANLIPPSWQYPDITCARIVIDSKEFKTPNFKESKYKQSADIKVYGKIAGAIEVYYLEKKPEIDEGPFLKEERDLINVIAERLGRITERKKAQEEVAQLSKFPSENRNPVLRITKNNNIIYANRASKPLLEEWNSEIGNPLPESFQSIIDDAIASGSNKNVEIVCRDITYLLTITPVKDEDYVNVYGLDITERKKIEEALHLNEERYALAQRAAHIGSWDWNIQTGDLVWSDQIEPIFGFKHGTFGRTYKAFLDCIHPDDRQRVIDSVNACLEKDVEYDIEHRIVWPDKSIYWVRETGDVIRDKNGKPIRMIGVVQDITERKKAEIEIKLVNAELDQIFNTAADGMRVIDKNFNIIRINDTFTKLVGISKNKVKGKKCYEVFPGPQCHTTKCPLIRILDGEDYLEYETEKRRYDGTKITCSATIKPYQGSDDELYGIVEDFKDITDRKRSEEKIKKLNENLMRQTVELVAINKELEAFSYSVSHDLRTPLRSIDGFSQALIEDYADKLDEEGRDYINRVRNATQHMGRIIDDLLKLSRITRHPLEKEKVNISDLSKSIIDDLKKEDSKRDVKFDISDDILVIGDKRLLRMALENIIGNAWKFTTKKSNAIIEMGKIRKNNQDVFFVRDNGAGFDMKYVDKLFVPFQRLHSDEEFDGIGIGLGIVNRIVHRHGGEIWAEGKEGEGATFYFSLRGGIEDE